MYLLFDPALRRAIVCGLLAHLRYKAAGDAPRRPTGDEFELEETKTTPRAGGGAGGAARQPGSFTPLAVKFRQIPDPARAPTIPPWLWCRLHLQRPRLADTRMRAPDWVRAETERERESVVASPACVLSVHCTSSMPLAYAKDST